MKTYRVVNDCVRMPFNRRRFRKDEVIDIEDDIVPGENFVLIEGPIEVVPEVNEGTSLSELQTKQKELASPKSGFASNINSIEPEKKMGRPKKKTAR